MATIEERATLDADKYIGKNVNLGRWLSHRLAYIRVATEQDRIARQEERERCIKAACKWLCEMCKCNKIGYDHACKVCKSKEHVRKAMEGGEA